MSILVANISADPIVGTALQLTVKGILPVVHYKQDGVLQLQKWRFPVEVKHLKEDWLTVLQ